MHLNHLLPWNDLIFAMSKHTGHCYKSPEYSCGKIHINDSKGKALLRSQQSLADHICSESGCNKTPDQILDRSMYNLPPLVVSIFKSFYSTERARREISLSRSFVESFYNGNALDVKESYWAEIDDIEIDKRIRNFHSVLYKTLKEFGNSAFAKYDDAHWRHSRIPPLLKDVTISNYDYSRLYDFIRDYSIKITIQNYNDYIPVEEQLQTAICQNEIALLDVCLRCNFYDKDLCLEEEHKKFFAVLYLYIHLNISLIYYNSEIGILLLIL